jgi:hypothetical protein
MKKLTIIFAKPGNINSRETYILPDGINGHDWKKLRSDYWYMINEEVNNALGAGKASVTIDLDTYPILNDNFNDLKIFMEENLIVYPGYIFTITEWNVTLQGAKSKFTAPCINRLDTSGFITQLLAKAKKQKHGK